MRLVTVDVGEAPVAVRGLGTGVTADHEVAVRVDRQGDPRRRRRRARRVRVRRELQLRRLGDEDSGVGVRGRGRVVRSDPDDRSDRVQRQRGLPGRVAVGAGPARQARDVHEEGAGHRQHDAGDHHGDHQLDEREPVVGVRAEVPEAVHFAFLGSSVTVPSSETPGCEVLVRTCRSRVGHGRAVREDRPGAVGQLQRIPSAGRLRGPGEDGAGDAAARVAEPLRCRLRGRDGCSGGRSDQHDTERDGRACRSGPRTSRRTRGCPRRAGHR